MHVIGNSTIKFYQRNSCLIKHKTLQFEKQPAVRYPEDSVAGINQRHVSTTECSRVVPDGWLRVLWCWLYCHSGRGHWWLGQLLRERRGGQKTVSVNFCLYLLCFAVTCKVHTFTNNRGQIDQPFLFYLSSLIVMHKRMQKWSDFK